MVRFRDIAGHRHLLELVAGAASRGTLPPSLIFGGPEGVGKRLAAVALAQFVNCLSRKDGDLDCCGTCAACTRISRGLHGDVLVVEPGETGSIKIDQVREAIDQTGYRPFEGRRRVIIVNDADAMQHVAQNALLKTLEEPPSASMFVLVTSRPDMLLPTVRSRCQRLRFGRVPAQEIADVLVRRHGYAATDAHAAASIADGSIGLALDGGVDTFVEARQTAAEVLQGAASGDTRRRLAIAKRLAGKADRDDLRRRLRAMASILRDLGALGERADEQCLANADLLGPLRRLEGSYDRGRVTEAFAAVDRALDAIDRNASPKIVADWVAFQL